MMIKRLILEGADDKHVVESLLYNYGLDRSFEFKPKEGIDPLLDTLNDELEATDADRFGIIVDADFDIAARWASLQRILLNAGYADTPNTPSPNGTLAHGPDGHVAGVWLMPDNRLIGMLEDFVSALIAPADNLWPKVKIDVNAIPPAHRKFKPSFLSKAMIHTWLAWQEEPGTRLGQTFRKRYLDPTHTNAIAFVDWIRRLVA